MELDQLRHMELEAWKHLFYEKEENPDDVVLWKDVDTCVREFDLERREVTLAYSAQSIDRDGDIIAQKGIDLKAFRKNPVVLFAHGGSRFGGDVRGQLPIARAMKLFRIGDEELIKSFAVDRFTEPEINSLGDTVFRMLTNKPAFLNAASIGFRPLDMERRDPEEDEVDQFYAPTLFKKVEKLEHSIVPVPANADALVGAKSAGIDLAPIKTWAEDILDDASFKEPVLTREHLENCYRIANGNTRVWSVPDLPTGEEPESKDEAPAEGEEMKDLLDLDGDAADDKGTIPSNPSGFGRADSGTAWTAPTLTRFGVTGPFEDLPTARKRRIAQHFAWAERMPPTAFGQLKLPHHRPADAAVVLRGVNAALAVLNGARGGVNIPTADKKPANGHLNTHRRAFGQEPIELRAMTDDEMKALLGQFARELASIESIDDADALEAIDSEVGRIISEATEQEKEEEVTEENKVEETKVEAHDTKTVKVGEIELVIDVKAKTAAELEAEAETVTKEEGDLEFPSVKAEEEASNDEVQVQVVEMRETQRSILGLLKQLVEAIKSTSTPKEEASSEKDETVETKDQGDPVMLIVEDDDPETKEEPSSGLEVGRFIANETAKAVTEAIQTATGRLPN